MGGPRQAQSEHYKNAADLHTRASRQDKVRTGKARLELARQDRASEARTERATQDQIRQDTERTKQKHNYHGKTRTVKTNYRGWPDDQRSDAAR